MIYKNVANPHVAIHLQGCGQIRKHGGQHKYGQGEYQEHATYDLAVGYAKGTGLRWSPCSFCRPERPKGE